MTMEKTIELPASHRITVDVPKEIPAGPVILTFRPMSATPAPKTEADDPITAEGEAKWRAYLKANSPKTIAEAEAEAERKLNDPNRKPFSRHYGALEGSKHFDDPVGYQKMMRAEWGD